MKDLIPLDKLLGVPEWAESLFENMPVSCIVFNANDEVVGLNETARRTFQVTLPWPATRLFRMLGRKQFLLVRSAAHEARRGHIQRLDTLDVTLPGRRRWIDATLIASGKHHDLLFALIIDQTSTRLDRDRIQMIQEIADFSQDLVFAAEPNGAIAFANKATAAILGCEPEQIIGRRRETLMPAEAANQHRMTDQIVLHSMSPVVRTEQLVVNNETLFFESYKFPITDTAGNVRAVGGISRNVTRERRFNEQLRFAEAMFHNARDAIAVSDVAGQAERVNRSFETLTGFSNTGLKGRPLRILGMGDAATKQIDSAMSVALRSGHWGGQLYFRNASGQQSIVWTRITSLLDDDGKKVGLMWIISDMSELQAANSMRIEAERQNEAKSEFLAIMSHELRTPLAGILGSIDILLDEAKDLPEIVRDKIANVQSAGDTLLQIVNDVLDMSRLQSGKMELEARSFRLDRLVRQVCEIHMVTADSRGVKFEIDLQDNCPTTYLGDRHRLAQVLHNVISNAVKFTPSGGFVTVSLLAGAPIRIVVTDSGIGMSPEEIERVFSPFEQADSTISRRFGGTGLGLSIVKQIIHLMHGDILFESEKGKGTKVELCLPESNADDVDEEDAIAAEDLSGANMETALEGTRVIVADDNDINRTVLATYLENSAATVTRASDGQSAIDAFKADPCEIVCLDISMPVLDGISTLKLIRSHCKAKKLPAPKIIAVTANAMSHQQKEYLSLGFDACLSKPFKRKDIVSLVRSLALNP